MGISESPPQNQCRISESGYFGRNHGVRRPRFGLEVAIPGIRRDRSEIATYRVAPLLVDLQFTGSLPFAVEARNTHDAEPVACHIKLSGDSVGELHSLLFPIG